MCGGGGRQSTPGPGAAGGERRSRSCGEEGEWGEWGEWGPHSVGRYTTQTETVVCGDTRLRARIYSASCVLCSDMYNRVGVLL